MCQFSSSLVFKCEGAFLLRRITIFFDGNFPITMTLFKSCFNIKVLAAEVTEFDAVVRDGRCVRKGRVNQPPGLVRDTWIKVCI